MSDNLEGMIAADRERLNREREALYDQQKEIETKLAEIEREFTAITAYENARSGKAARGSSVPAKPRASSGKGSRGPRGTGKREDIYRMVADADGGMSRADLIDKLGFKGDKAGETSVSNALSALKKAGRLASGERGRYVAK